MDWQQPIALAIVILTAGLMIRSRWRARRAFTPASPCGCSAGNSNLAGKSITLRGKRGERPELVVRG